MWGGSALPVAPHPFGDDDVDLLRQLDLLHVALDHGDRVLEAVLADQPARLLRHARRLDGVHTFGACHCGPDGEHAASGAHVEHDLVLEAVGVLQDRVAVPVHPPAVLQHVLLVVEVACRGRHEMVSAWAQGCWRWQKGRVATHHRRRSSWRNRAAASCPWGRAPCSLLVRRDATYATPTRRPSEALARVSASSSGRAPR